MLFTTLTYFIFFWLVFGAYWAIKKRSGQNLLILGASYIFYAWWDYRFLSLILASTLIDYFGAIGIEKAKEKSRRKIILSVCVGSNLSILFLFKYYDFFIDSFENSLGFLGLDLNLTGLALILPLGISFYTFQTISYTVDIYRGKAKACFSLIDYAAYVCFFPQLVAGPIERGRRLIPQFTNKRTFSEKQCQEGLRLALWGVFKKLVIADNLAHYVDLAYSNPASASGLVLLIATIAFAFQIYCDFSGYSDIAIGCARLLGFKLMRNFAFPYFSQDLGEFWRRWHISLSTWFRDYVYIPLGGTRSSMGAWLRNVLITFTLSGLWHGAALNFVIWGLLNGIGYILFASQTKRGSKDVPLGEQIIPGFASIIKAVGVFGFICVTWVFFRALDFKDAMLIFEKILKVSSYGDAAGTVWASYGNAFFYIVPLAFVEFMTRKYQHPFHAIVNWPVWARWTSYFILIAATLYLMPENQAVFVYFQF